MKTILCFLLLAILASSVTEAFFGLGGLGGIGGLIPCNMKFEIESSKLNVHHLLTQKLDALL
ncbi:hypothetical protein QR680_016446 [Steinernema hermaphroditum]|uniref:Uncharacterized protein n=1 Tax=Steinernema hermaphroditum TaxID=289476 RepID=A0AA39HB87_9BILA|nr:hypothetical protein QR680_016446 [Steinernema hermaphroditum]